MRSAAPARAGLPQPRVGDEAAIMKTAHDGARSSGTKHIHTLVDLTVLGLGRNIPRIQQLVSDVRINVVVATGYYTAKDLPAYFHQHGPGSRIDGPEPLEQMLRQGHRDRDRGHRGQGRDHQGRHRQGRHHRRRGPGAAGRGPDPAGDQSQTATAHRELTERVFEEPDAMPAPPSVRQLPLNAAVEIDVFRDEKQFGLVHTRQYIPRRDARHHSGGN